MQLDKEFIIVDTETTGKHGMLYSVCELAAARIDEDFNVIDQFHSENYIKPMEEQYLKESMNIHGIAKETLEAAPSFEEVINPFILWIFKNPQCTLASWGIAFDFPFMQCQFFKLNKSWPEVDYRYFDIRTVLKWESLCSNDKADHSLREYCDIYDVKYDRYHRAMDDVNMTVNLFRKIKEKRERDAQEMFNLNMKLRDYDYYRYMRGNQ